MNSDPTLNGLIFSYLSPLLYSSGIPSGKVYFGYQNGPQLTEEYAVLFLQSYEETQTPELRERYTDNVDKYVTEQIFYRYTASVSLDVFGDSAGSRVRVVKSLLYSTESVERAQLLNIGFRSYGDTQNLDYMFKGEYLPRAAFTIDLHLTSVTALQIGSIGQVTIIGTEPEEDREIVNITVTEL